MRQNALLRLLLAFFLMYMAWPNFQSLGEGMKSIFQLAWVTFFLLVVGANLAVLLRVHRKPELKVTEEKKLVLGKN